MKKNIIALVSLAIAFIGCTSIEPEPVVTPEPKDSHYSIKASIVNVTKTSIADDGAMAWIAGDKIDVYDGDFEEFTLVSEPTGAEAVFSGELYSPEDANIAFCPSGIGADVADEMLLFNLPASYEYDGQSTHAPMIATGFAVNAHEATISFKHIGGLFKITYNNVPEEATTFCFEASKQITGDLYMEDYTVNNPALAVGDNSEEGNIVTYSFSSGHPSTMSFYVPVPVGTFDFSISLLDATGATIAKSNKTKSNFTINRGDYVNIPAINMPKKLVENFNTTSTSIKDIKVGNGAQTSTAGNTNGYDFSWDFTGNTYVFKNGVRLGSGSNTGSATNSTMLEDLTAETFTVKVYAAVWNTDGGEISVTYNKKTLTASAANDAIGAPTTTDYTPELFANATSFVFEKAQDVNEFTVASTSKRIMIDKIEVVEGGDVPQAFSVSTTNLAPTWDATEASFDIVAGGKVSWSILADDGLTFSKNGTDYSAELEGTGNASITVAFAQNTEEDPVEKTILVSTEYTPVEGESEYEIAFVQDGKPAREMDGDGSAENPYSIVDALYLINNLDDNGTTSKEVYLKGIIVGESAGIDTNYGNATFYLADAAGSDNQLTAYRVKDLGNVNFTATDQLAVGDEVVVYAKLKKYVKNSEVTPETDQGYVYSINGHTSILAGISLGEKKTIYYTGEEFVKPVVTASYRGADPATVTTTTSFTGYDLTAIGKQTVSASYTENGITKSSEYEITVKDGTNYTISASVNDASMGSVSVKVGEETATSAKAEETVTVTISPATGYIVNAVTLNGVDKTAQLSNNTLTFQMPAQNTTVAVTFAARPADKTTGTQTSFSTINGTVNADGNISYAATKGNGTTTPVINSNKIRLYKPSSGNTTGGILTLTANNGAKITKVVIKTSRNSFNIAADGVSITGAYSGSSPYTVTVDNLDANSVSFTNTYTDSNDISSIEVWYYGGQEIVCTPLTSPTGLSCTAQTSSSLTFGWNAVTNASGYKVSTDGGTSYGETQYTTTYTWTGLEAESTHTLYVKAVGDGRCYSDSDPVSAEGTTTTEQGGGSKYVKVTKTSDLADGQYLIVYETKSVALDGRLTSDVAANTVAVSISNNEIASTTEIDAAAVTFSEADGSFLGGGGKYIGHTGSSNSLNYSTSALENTVTIDSGNVVISAGDYVMRYNASSGQDRFRYYKSGQQAIQLYKKVN